MLDIKTMRALGMLMARNAREKVKSESATPNETIDFSPLLKAWEPGFMAAGDVVTYNGYPYQVVQEHDSSATPDWTPVAAPALFAPYHGTDALHALPWVRPTAAHDAYYAGEYMRWADGAVYRCMLDGTVHSPEEYPGAWELTTA